MNIIKFFEYAAEWFDVFGVAVIVFGMVMATLHFLINKFSNEPDSYDAYRKNWVKPYYWPWNFLSRLILFAQSQSSQRLKA